TDVSLCLSSRRFDGEDVLVLRRGDRGEVYRRQAAEHGRGVGGRRGLGGGGRARRERCRGPPAHSGSPRGHAVAGLRPLSFRVRPAAEAKAMSFASLPKYPTARRRSATASAPPADPRRPGRLTRILVDVAILAAILGLLHELRQGATALDDP